MATAAALPVLAAEEKTGALRRARTESESSLSKGDAEKGDNVEVVDGEALEDDVSDVGSSVIEKAEDVANQVRLALWVQRGGASDGLLRGYYCG